MLTEEFSTNRILAGLPPKELDLLLPLAERVEVQLGDTLVEARSPLQYIHFPITAAISMTSRQDHEHMVEVTLTGKEGSSGSSIVLGETRSLCTAMIQIPGIAVRIPTSALIGHLSYMPYLQAALARHNSLILQIAIISVGCSRFHTVPQQVARWLKAHWHRTGIETFPFSAQFLAAQVGADSKVVADTLKTLSEKNILDVGRNKVTIADHHALTSHACECYELAKQATEDYLLALAQIARSHMDT